MMTEEEAKKKWCPQTFNVDPICNEYGEPIRDAGPCYCLGSACMAWRWFDAVSDDGTGCHRTPTRMTKREPEPPEQTPRPLADRRGYCGLSGKP